MKQGTLFGNLDAYGHPIKARDAALDKVEAHAEADEPGFMDRAMDFVLAYLEKHGPTPEEDITDAATDAGIIPAEKRAFGAVYMRLAKRRKIIKAGTCTRRKGHGTAGGNIWKLASGD